MQWLVKPFSALTNDELYAVLKLRVDIFVVEQACAYPELDDKDQHPDVRHLMVWDADTLAAYLRILPPNASYEGFTSLGRVVLSAAHRGQGLGHDLLRRGVAEAMQQWPNDPIKIGAQAHLQAYYAQHGFQTVSDTYLEDGIPHVDMVRTVQSMR